MKDISSPTVMVTLLSFFTDMRSLTEKDQKAGSVHLKSSQPLEMLSGIQNNPTEMADISEDPLKTHSLGSGTQRSGRTVPKKQTLHTHVEAT